MLLMYATSTDDATYLVDANGVNWHFGVDRATMRLLADPTGVTDLSPARYVAIPLTGRDEGSAGPAT